MPREHKKQDDGEHLTFARVTHAERTLLLGEARELYLCFSSVSPRCTDPEPTCSHGRSLLGGGSSPRVMPKGLTGSARIVAWP